MANFDYENILFLDAATIDLDEKNLLTLKINRFIEMLNELPENAKILEIACGIGTFTQFIRRHYPQFRIFGLDLSTSALKTAKKIEPEGKFVKADVINLPCTDESFDLVCGFDILEHVPDVEGVIDEVKRVMKRNAFAYFHVPCEDQFLNIWWILRRIGIWGDLKEKHAGHIKFFKIKGINKTFHNRGFNIVKQLYSYHLIGQILDVLQWKATAIRREEGNSSMREIADSGGEKRSILSYFFKAYKGITKILGNLSYYESKIFSRIPFAMATDITLEKLK